MPLVEQAFGKVVVGLGEARFEVPKPFEIPGSLADFDEVIDGEIDAGGGCGR